ncbi:Hypothetical predicted protein [Mytilus galloprovincialis]|uniref:Uncharacterized protein n=2 Tax=Mytilus galloprovincialis TaxID=29158 RepID=A0A8B6GWK7_MYTGA|nr:Hypothetical predicted protein [Mytilus galloprovincialis]
MMEQAVPQVLGPLEPDEPAEDQSAQVVAEHDFIKPNLENYVQAATAALKAVRTAKQALIDSLQSGDDDDDDNYTSDNDESDCDCEITENIVDNIFSFSRD